MTVKLQPGDIASAIRELNTAAKFCSDAAISYDGHPAPDEIARSFNKHRSDLANARAAGFDRVITLLAAQLVNKETSHAG